MHGLGPEKPVINAILPKDIVNSLIGAVEAKY